MPDTSAQLRSADHLVLPVASLDAARARYRALGFTVAPDGVHPFGTVNACVYLADGSFLEPLAVGDPQAANAAVAAGNVFVARDRAFRSHVAAEGCSALVLSTADAHADHSGNVASGVSAGPLLEFQRPFVDAGGRRDVASFRLAFADLPSAAESFVFTCQRLDAPKVDRAALTAHANGATALCGVTLVADDPAPVRQALARLARGDVDPDGAVTLGGGCRVEVAGADEFAARFGRSLPYRGCGFALLSFAVRDLGAVRRWLDAEGVACTAAGGGLHVAAAAGQGVDFVFVEAP